MDDFGGMVRDGKREREGEENMRKQGRLLGSLREGVGFPEANDNIFAPGTAYVRAS